MKAPTWQGYNYILRRRLSSSRTFRPRQEGLGRAQRSSREDQHKASCFSTITKLRDSPRRAMLHLWLFSEFIWPKYSRTEISRCHFFHSSRTAWPPRQTATLFVFDHPRTLFKKWHSAFADPSLSNFTTPEGNQAPIRVIKTKYPQREMKDFREGGKQLAR